AARLDVGPVALARAAPHRERLVELIVAEREGLAGVDAVADGRRVAHQVVAARRGERLILEAARLHLVGQAEPAVRGAVRAGVPPRPLQYLSRAASAYPKLRSRRGSVRLTGSIAQQQSTKRGRIKAVE